MSCLGLRLIGITESRECILKMSNSIGLIMGELPIRNPVCISIFGGIGCKTEMLRDAIGFVINSMTKLVN